MLRYLLLLCLLCLTIFCWAQKIDRPREYTALQDSLLQGWNTWHNPNVLSFVKMPEGLALQLVFRKRRGGPYWLRDSYISKRDSPFPEHIDPGLHSYDGSYIEYDLEWEGMKANIRSATVGEDVVILFTPLEAPDNPHILALETGFLWNKPGQLQRQTDSILAKVPTNTYTIRSTKTSTDIALPFVTPYLTFSSDETIAFYTGAPKTLEAIEAILEEQKAGAKQQAQQFGDLAEAYRAMQSVTAWNLIYDVANNRGIASVSRVWNEAWGGYIIFDWDTYFIALMAALESKELAYSNAIAITHALTDNGFVPNLEASFGVKSFDRSQPPVGSIVCNMLYEKFGERWFLEEVYPELLTWNRWWAEHRDNQGYLSWGSDDHPKGMQGNTKQGAKWESGLDNSPLFDEAVFDTVSHKLQLASVGLMGLYVADCKALADIATILGKPDDAKELLARAEKYTASLQTLWDEETGIFRDKYLNTGEFSPHLAPTHFYPLIGEVATQEQAERMMAEHFFNPEEFYGEWIMPSIARNDPGFPDNEYWRGRIWAPMNFLVYLGIQNYNLPKARKVLVEKSLQLIMKEWTENRRVYENYDPHTGGAPSFRSSGFYAWGGLLSFIALLEAGYWD